MDVYGLTGGIGSGKSTVAALLEDYGVPVVSADELSRIVVARGSDGLADVVASFGEEVLDDVGELDRRKMASIVFRDPSRRRDLESILHPRIRERFEQVLDALEKAGHGVAVYEVPLLFEKNLQGEMKAVVLVTAEEDVRIARVRGRDDVTETEVRARMATQMDESLKRKRADYIIDNSGTMDSLRREVEFLLRRFLRIGARASSEAAPAAAARTADSTPISVPPAPEPVRDTEPQPSRVRTEIPSTTPAIRTGATLPPGVITAPARAVGANPGAPAAPIEPTADKTPPDGTPVRDSRRATLPAIEASDTPPLSPTAPGELPHTSPNVPPVRVDDDGTPPEGHG